MTNRGKKRALALCLSLALLVGMLPAAAFAAEEGPPCPNHPTHEGCGYVAAVEGQPCKHELGEHDAACGWTEGTPEIPCDLGCAELDESGAVLHREGCAYTPAVAGTPCAHLAGGLHDADCGYMAAVAEHPCGHACDLCAALDSGPAPLSAPAPRGAAETVGAFQVTGDATGYEYANNVLTIKDGADLTIANTDPTTATQDRIVVASGATNVKLTLDGVNIKASGPASVCAFDMTGAEVELTLADGSNNILKSMNDRAGLRVPRGSTLTIGGSGALEATGGVGGAGIGGTSGNAFVGTITIGGGARVTATGGDSAAGIGGDSSGGGGTITIQGSARVTATGGNSGAGIGGGDGGDGGTIIIEGSAQVTATGGDNGAGIGSGNSSASGGGGGAVTVDGDAVVFAVGGKDANDIGADRGGHVTKTLTKGVVFEGDSGKVYGDVTLPGDLTVPDGYTLTIQNSATLTVPDSATLTVEEGAALTNNGTIDGNGILTGSGNFDGSGNFTLKAGLSSAAVTGITPPVAGATPDTGAAVAADARYTAGVVTWKSGQAGHTGNFAYETVYTASVTLTVTNNTIYQFTGGTTGTVNGAAATVDGGGNTVTLSYIFPKTEDKTYTIAANSQLLDFGSATAGYAAAPSPQTVTVSNTGNQAVTLTQPAAGDYDVGALSKAALDPGETATFTVQPKTGLAAGTHSESLTITTANATSAAVALTFTVTAQNTDGGNSDSSGPSYYSRSLSDAASGVKLSGGSIHESARLTVEAGTLHKAGDAGCDLLRSAQAGGHLLGAWDVSLSRGFRGNVTISLPVEGRDGDTLTVAHCVDGKLTLSNVKVSGGFAKVEAASLSPFAVLDGAYTLAELEALAAPGKENPNTGGDNPFTDVKETDWFFNAVMYVYQGGIMQGTSDTTFSPNDGTTRAQLAVILWRMEGSPAPTGGNPFSDVPDGTWYTEAVAWCSQAELVGGYGGLFGPGDPITREQLAALLYRYAQYKGWDVSMGGDTNILSYTDAFDVSEWAIPAVQWACGAGIMGGTTDNRLAPQEGATRAQIAAMLMRLLEKYAPGSVLPASGGTVTPNPGTGVLNAPRTGDGSGAGWLMLALPVSAAGAAALSFKLRRKRREDGDELPDPTHA